MGGLVALAGIISLLLAPLLGSGLTVKLWGVEPLTYIGAALLIVGLAVTSLSYLVQHFIARRSTPVATEERSPLGWSEVTQQYFEMFSHDFGRPFRRILGKARELRTLLQAGNETPPPAVEGLLVEIEQQVPHFRLMVSNIQVLVQLEEPITSPLVQPVEPAEVVRRIVDRYGSIAVEQQKEITWWAEPSEFGIVYSDTSTIEHIVTNLVDNAFKFAREHIEIRLTKNPSHFFIRVWDDGSGIPSHYVPHIFDRGWTPEVARREEKSSSGLGLFIAQALAHRYQGEIVVDTATAPPDNAHTAFLLSLPLHQSE